jgi:hypothetical protein
MLDASVAVDKETRKRRIMEILDQRYKECDESPNRHLSPVSEKCVHCYRHLHYQSNNDSLIQQDYSAGIIAITLRFDDGRLK